MEQTDLVVDLFERVVDMPPDHPHFFGIVLKVSVPYVYEKLGNEVRRCDESKVLFLLLGCWLHHFNFNFIFYS